MGKTLYHTAATVLLVVLCSALCGGCTMCQQCELDSYSAYGGRWERTDREHGRVGSVFAPAGGLVPYDPATDPHAVPDEEPSAAPGLRPPGGGSDEAEAAPDDSVLQSEAEREAQEARERRLRELQLEDIRFQK